HDQHGLAGMDFHRVANECLGPLFDDWILQAMLLARLRTVIWASLYGEMHRRLKCENIGNALTTPHVPENGRAFVGRWRFPTLPGRQNRRTNVALSWQPVTVG